MYKNFLEKMQKNETPSEKNISEKQAIQLIKEAILNKFENYSDIEDEELKKNALKAFGTGLSILGLIHAAGDIGGKKPIIEKPKEYRYSSEYADKTVQPKPKKTYSENPEIQEAYDEAYKNAGKTKESIIGNFLNSISMNESSGGVNTKHKQMEGGIHAGDRALGSYGLMPNTIKEMAVRMGKDSPFYSYSKMDNSAISDSIKKNPEHERQIASYMANHLYDRFGGDESKMAYSWNQGHNLTNDHFEGKHKSYKDHDYVKKYHKNKQVNQTNPIASN
jgi:hypothetical protein